MTPEQQTRLNEIKQRYKQGETAWHLNDMGLLLSLIDSQGESGESCFICKALLLEPDEPPHCEDCQVTDEDYERWIEEGEPR